MNRVVLMGRLTKDPEGRREETAYARFTLAVDRKKKDEADFISCVAFGKTAEFLLDHFKHGNKIAISGRIQTGSYTNRDGRKVYTTDVVAEECEFCEKRELNEPATVQQVRENVYGFADTFDFSGTPFE